MFGAWTIGSIFIRMSYAYSWWGLVVETGEACKHVGVSFPLSLV